jgi:hypothetical protein
VADTPPAVHDLVCLHCRKPFRAEVLGHETEQAGVKCPHCKLFMPLERVEHDEDAEDAESLTTFRDPLKHGRVALG